MNRSTFSLASIRRCSPLVALLTLVVFLASFVPYRVARADDSSGSTPVEHGVGGTGSLASASPGAASTSALASVDPATGSAHASLPFVLPKARGLAQPSLALSYDSSSGPGVAGIGWSLNIPSIERRNPSGFPRFVDGPPGTLTDPVSAPDDFVANGQPLVPICVVSGATCSGIGSETLPPKMDGATYYRTEVDDFTRYFFSADRRTWTVQQKSGVWMEYGVPLDNPTDQSGMESHDFKVSGSVNTNIYRWNLVRMFDPHFANVVVFKWAALGSTDTEQPTSADAPGLRYLTDIYDTLPIADANADRAIYANLGDYAHHTHLFWRNRDTTLMQTPGWRGVPALVLGDVAVSSMPMLPAASRSLVRLYHLTYSDPTAFEQRFLQTFEVHACAKPETNGNVPDPSTWVASCPSLPATTLTWSQPQAAVKFVDSGVLTPTPNATHNMPLDLDGDGVPEFVDPSSVAMESRPAPPAVAPRCARSLDLMPGRSVGYGDWLSDGRVNVLWMADFADPTTHLSCGGGGDGEVYSLINGKWAGVGGFPIAPMVDPDHNAQWDNSWYWSWGKQFDVDGDGLNDVAMVPLTHSKPGFTRSYFTSRAKNGQLAPFQRYGMAFGNISGYLPTTEFHAIADMDADGLADLIQVHKQPDPGSSTFGPTTTMLWWKNRGDGRLGMGSGDTAILPAREVLVATGPDFNVQLNQSNIAVGDITGDGLADFISFSAASGLDVWIQRPRAAQMAGGVSHEFIQLGTTPPAAFGWTKNNAPADSSLSVMIGDVDGSTSPKFWLFAPGGKHWTVQAVDTSPRYGLLRTISDGSGRQTTLNYDSTTHLGQLASQANKPWTTKLPQPAQVVTSIATTATDLGGAAQNYAENYSYADPLYDARDRVFLGFRTVSVEQPGDGAQAPGLVTTMTYEDPRCQSVAPGKGCADGTDYGWRVRRGRLITASKSEDTPGGRLFSVSVNAWHYRVGYHGMDGRTSRQVYVSERIDFLGDSATTQTFPGVAVFVEEGEDVKTYEDTVSVTVPGVAVPLRRTHEVNRAGDETSTVDYGQMGVDAPVRTQVTWSVPSESWVSRPTQKLVGYADTTGQTFSGAPREMDWTYDTFGQVKTVYAPLSGSEKVTRTLGAPQPPMQSSDGTVVQSASYTYDAYGNVTQVQRPNARCVGMAYDTWFAELPVTVSAYRGGCGSSPLNTTQSYDRGLGLPTIEITPGLSMTRKAYDAFGRLIELDQPSPWTPSAAAAHADTIIDYSNFDTKRILHVQHITKDTGVYTDAYTYFDAYGRSRFSLEPAETSGAWIVSGAASLYKNGRVAKSYTSFGWSGTPTQFAGQIPATTKSNAYVYDALGRLVTSTRTDGTTIGSYVYHPLSSIYQDGEQLSTSSLHFGSWTTKKSDGHGRLVATVQHMVSDPVDDITTSVGYLATGEVASVTRSHSGSSEKTTRTMTYDSLGRLVLNVEPNTSYVSKLLQPGFPQLRAWRYAYDDAGDLVGTSDARGCGENMTYDTLGRLTGEDYAPCLSTHEAYSAPNPWTGAGYETFFVYDAPEIPTSTLATNYLGKMTASYDRGAHTRTEYDVRGRITAMERQIAVPHAGSVAFSARYSAHWFRRDVNEYDEANRLVSATTGIDPAVIQQPLSTWVRASFTARGTVGSIDSSYGTLLASQTFDASGQLTQQVLGDAASTTLNLSYWDSGRVKNVSLGRGNGPWVSSGSYVIGGAPSATTLEGSLENVQLQYDLAGNPTSITDSSTAAWPTGSLPSRRALTYDDEYRLRSVSTDYGPAFGDDGYRSPYAPEQARQDRTFPTPLNVPNRVRKQFYTYDWLNNLKSSNDEGNAFVDRSLGAITTAPGTHRLAASTLGTSSLAAQYDDAGNVSGITVQRPGPYCTQSCTMNLAYAWDELGRLASATRTDDGGTAPTVSENFTYDSAGARVLTEHVTTLFSATTYDVDVFATLQLQGAHFLPTAHDYERTARTETVLLGAQGLSLGRVVYSDADPAVSASGTTHVFLEVADHLGSTSFVIDKATGELVEHMTYQAFGSVDSDFRPDRWAGFREARRYTGQEDEAAVGLVYVGRRYYSTILSRWLSPDPLAIHAMGSDSNPYAFVLGSPLRQRDPNGLDTGGCDNMSPGCSSGGIDLGALLAGIGSLFGGGGSSGGRKGGGGGTSSQTKVEPPPPANNQGWATWTAYVPFGNLDGPSDVIAPVVYNNTGSAPLNLLQNAWYGIANLEVVAINTFANVPTMIDTGLRLAGMSPLDIATVQGMPLLRATEMPFFVPGALEATAAEAREAWPAIVTDFHALLADNRGSIDLAAIMRGLQFQADATQGLNLQQNFARFSSVTLAGQAGTTIPDSMMGAVIEIKDVRALSFTGQLQLQFNLAQQNGVPFNLIVSPRTVSIVRGLQNAVRSTGGTIQVYDDATGAIRLW